MKDKTLILGRKIGMTQVFIESGELIPVTVIQAGPCYVSQIKTNANDGYCSVQVSFEQKKQSNVTKPLLGHFSKNNLNVGQAICEFRTDGDPSYKVGDVIDISIFSKGEKVDVIGTSKGRGFQGVMKRYGFAGGPASHGSMFHRRGGSYGQRQWPGHVYKGRKMPGHTGCDRVTIQNLEVVDLKQDRGVILLKGGVPGANDCLIAIRKAQKAKCGKKD
ncbi:MAG: 50S ribosomal protein L3 [Puniceicoccales bacterium]|jgi:large subunit ribosomal protein L3|nr:50S ribosomal protein L3 [Puniceicoccales bacterium]